jgi:hypothetical protein
MITTDFFCMIGIPLSGSDDGTINPDFKVEFSRYQLVLGLCEFDVVEANTVSIFSFEYF